jgi:aerobic-type carbon monoxide dehydrogenase small subunit (CoxS/CutS family)
MLADDTLACLLVNGRAYDVRIPPNRLLLEVLREELGLTGTKRGCDDGSCGACTIMVAGEPMLACMMLALAYQDCPITTIEGIAADDLLVGGDRRGSPGTHRDRIRSAPRRLRP